MKIIIDSMECEAEHGEYILQIAKRSGIFIPTLCHNDSLPGIGSCRLCIVEVIEGKRARVVTSCLYPVTAEVTVSTNSEKISRVRKNIIKLLLLRSPQNEAVIKLGEKYGIKQKKNILEKDSEQCILCGLCVKACEKLGTSAISSVNRGIEKKISTPYEEEAEECIGCGACAYVCPTGAIKMAEEGGYRKIWGKNFKLITCENCGEGFSVREHYEYALKNAKVKEDKVLCEKCRKKSNADKFKDIYANVIYR